MRVLGIDYGQRRIGLAVSDPTATIATPLDTLRRRRGRRPPLKALAEIAVAHGIERIVVGLPLDLSGRETEWTREVRDVGERLAERLDVPVEFVDERFTSVRAERTIRSLRLPKTRTEEKGRVDAAAAALILQLWLDGRRGPR